LKVGNPSSNNWSSLPLLGGAAEFAHKEIMKGVGQKIFALPFLINLLSQNFSVMMKINIGGWVGIIGGLIGLIVGIGAVIATAGRSSPFITIFILVIFGGMFYLFYRLFFKPMINAARLQKTGLPGKATILEVRDTGVTINNNPQVKLMLEVKNSYGQKYKTQCRMLVSRINPNAFMPGMD
jgi:hypothetical protein